MPFDNLYKADVFWSYALAVYQQPGVKTLCLQLQDVHQANVNLLLLSGWLAHFRLTWSAPLLVQLVRENQPLDDRLQAHREVRRAAKDSAQYPALLQQELALEAQQQKAFLSSLKGAVLTPMGIHPLSVYLALRGMTDNAQCRPLHEGFELVSKQQVFGL